MFSTQTDYGPEKDALGDKLESKHRRSVHMNKAGLKFIHAFLWQRKLPPECSLNQFLFMATQEGEKKISFCVSVLLKMKCHSHQGIILSC